MWRAHFFPPRRFFARASERSRASLRR
jgi:hypothetical protein